MATLDKHADDQNWKTVGGKKRLTPDSDAQMHGVALVDTGDVANRYDKMAHVESDDVARRIVEEQPPTQQMQAGETYGPTAPPYHRRPGNDAGLGTEPRPTPSRERAPLADL